MPKRAKLAIPATPAASPNGHQHVAHPGTPGAEATAACPRCGAHGRWALRRAGDTTWLAQLGAGCARTLGDDEWLDLGDAARAFLD